MIRQSSAKPRAFAQAASSSWGALSLFVFCNHLLGPLRPWFRGCYRLSCVPPECKGWSPNLRYLNMTIFGEGTFNGVMKVQ